MINRTPRLFALAAIFFLLMISCASKPKPPAGPDQALLDELNAAMARAQSGRVKAMAVKAQVYFPDEWSKAEADNNAGRNAGKDTADGVRLAIASFNSAADGYEAIAGKAALIFAKEQEEANSALKAAMARAEKSRKDAQDSQAPKYFPDEWAGAEAERQNGLDAQKETLEEIKAAVVIFNSAADSYDAIAGKTRELIAKEKAEADGELQAAMARAEKSRQAAMNVNGQTYFPNDWRNAEAKNTSGKNARKTTPDEIRAAAALFVSAADAYDDIAGKSRERFAKDSEDANKALQAAMARAEKSRQAAVSAEGQTYLPNDWRNAETKYNNGKNAKRTTLDEMKAAAALFVSAADAYDDIVRKTQQMIAKEKDDAAKALQAAMARAEKSRKDVQDAKGNVNFPDDWNNAEAKYRTAGNAKRATAAEMKAAAPLYIAAADAYDDIIKKNLASLNEQNRKSVDDAKVRAEQERQKALDVKADIAAAGEFNKADTVFKQAEKDFNEKNFTRAVENYNTSADQFIAAARLANEKKALANEAIAEAKQKSSQSADFAVNTASEMGINKDELLNNRYMLENLRLIGLAENAYADSKYDDAVAYAKEAVKNAGLSDEYASLQMKIKGALDAIAAAQARLDRIKELNAHVKYADIYDKAEQTFAEALDFRSKEDWSSARQSALSVIAILANIPDAPVLPAQYLVRTWNSTRDCLWNIAAKKEIYGDPFKWRVIYNANRHKLPRPGNPNLIEPGTLLDIPSIAGEYRSGIMEE